MFNQLKELVAKVTEYEYDLKKHADQCEVRKTLQEIKVESLRLRKEVSNKHKELKAVK